MEELGITELKRLTEVIHQKFGYDFSGYAMSSFKRRITRIMELKKVNSLDQFIQFIETKNLTKEDFLHEITVNVTELFRDPSFWRVLKTVLPKTTLNSPKVKIWHAGCSSGEEVYSMLIVLKELGMIDMVEILASDIDSSILKKAKEGKISLRNMELNEKNYIRYNPTGDVKQYFLYDNDYAYFSKELLSKVTFKEINLVNLQPFAKFDMILCRNVMIYFNQNLQNQILKTYHEMLQMYGYLIVGTKESIIWSDSANKFLTVNTEEKIYKKYKD
ncbi:MAG: protein-glutamate O-methyltransferase CheR [Cytophagaceae bacterium]|jgi:chemotaxis protein methyltransferase CheR|nr:protein-glutamate O-methyltransferase CheR [Cytophagaceae bacterium]